MAGLYDTNKALPIPEIGNTIINSQSDAVPFLRMVKKGAVPKQMLQSWAVEQYPDRAFTGALDGADVSTYSYFARVKMESYAMLMRTTGVQVTKLAQLTVDAGVGRKQEFARQLLNDGKILAQMMERACLANLDLQAESGSTPYRTRGAFSWLSPTAQGTKSVDSDFRPSSGCVSTVGVAEFTDTVLETMLEAMATQKKAAVNLKGICGLKVKRAMSMWGQKATGLASTEQAIVARNSDADRALMQVVDKFEFDSGVVYTMPSFYLACTESTGAASLYTARSALFIDTKMWEIGYLQEPAAFQNPDLGGGPRAWHDAVFVLKCLNPIGQGYLLTAQDSES